MKEKFTPNEVFSSVWLPGDHLPRDKRQVLAWDGRDYRICRYFRDREEEIEDDDGDEITYDYDHEKQKTWLRAGWYEENETPGSDFVWLKRDVKIWAYITKPL